VELAKKQGKIRFSGMSGHGANLVACLDYAFEHEMVDVVLSAYNFAQDPTFYERLKIEAQQWLREGDFVATLQAVPATLAKGKAKGVGIVCMKTLRGARKHDLRPYEPGRATFAQAALRWVLSNPNVDVALITMPDPAHVDEYLLASGWTKPARGDLGLLQRYEDLHGAVQCRYGCNLCSESCPHEVAIPEVLRTLMYARDYERPQLARREYSRLGEGASACLSCAHHSCVGACPFGLAIDRLTTDAHRLLGSRG
jgi:predicted aldo/keto reductase-like oxidoreductase